MTDVLRWDGLGEIPEDVPAGVVTIGVFDGVHRGHRDLIRTAVRSARRDGLTCTVLTFDPNPIEVLGHGAPPTRLATLRHRLSLIADIGVDACAVLPFDENLAAMSAERFVTEVLVDRLRMARIVVGENFRFGRKARGDVDLLERMSREQGFDVSGHNLMTLSDDGEPVSSSLIRRLVADGDVAGATRCLARPHRVEGTVVEGDRRGRALGSPTANLAATPLAAIPADGVYAARLVVDPYERGRLIYPAAVSIGTNPTFDGADRRIEAFAYNETDLDIYSREVAVDFVAHLREQRRFDSSEALAMAIGGDVAQCRAILGA